MKRWKFSKMVKISVILTVIVLVATVKLFDWKEKQKTKEPRPVVFKEDFLKVFHLDLKGGPPKLSFLLKILPLARGAGANALLIEYEDMFPFSGSLRNVSAGNAYTLTEVRKLVEFAEELRMEVIPLVQSFGHLEYVLKLEEFQHLREVEHFPQEICPRNHEAVNLVKELIGQVMDLHKNSRYIHLGCDEVRHLGFCRRCYRRDSKKLFSNHVVKIASHVRNKYPGVTPLIWDDMLRRWTFRDMANSWLGTVVEPVVWVYGKNIFLLVPPAVWNSYKSVFPKLWVASAFKGAFGEKEILPNLTFHLDNNLSWLRVLKGEAKEVALVPEAFSGIFLTGWSRYDHFAVLCELLPIGIPSLLLDLLFLEPSYHKTEAFARWLRLLGCPQHLLKANATALESRALFQSELGACSFPGSNLYWGISKYIKLRTKVDLIAQKMHSSGWFSRYNLENNFTSTWRLTELLPDSGKSLKRELSLWKTSFFPLMSQYFDEATASEWGSQNVAPLEETLTRIQNDFNKLMKRKTWPRRPLR